MLTIGGRARGLAALVLATGLSAPGVARAAACGAGTTACGPSTAVTYNGVALTFLGSATNGTVQSEIWYLKAPPSGSHNVVVTAQNATDVTATSMSFTGVDQTSMTFVGSPVTAIGTSTTPSLSVPTTGLGNPVFDVVGAVGSNLPAVSGNQTLRRTNNTSAGLNPVVIGSSTAAGQTSAVTMGWTISSSTDWAQVAVAIRGSSAVTSVGIDSFTASWESDDVLLEWQGGYEPKSAGFIVYRSDGGGARVPLNADIIPGDAIRGKASSYAWRDATTGWNGDVAYWLKDLKVDGSFTWVGPAVPMAVGVTAPAAAPAPTLSSADGGDPSQWRGASQADPALGGCAFIDHTPGRGGLQIVLVLGMIAGARRRRHRLLAAGLFFAAIVVSHLVGPGRVAAAGGATPDATATATGFSGLTFAHVMGAGSNGLLLVGVVTPVICQTTATDSGNCGGCGSTCPLSIASSIDSGLLGLWHFSEGSGATSADASGNGNTATLGNSPSWVAGYAGKALQPSALGTSYVYAPVGAWFGANQTLSASAWVYATATTNGPVFGVTDAPPGGNWNMPFLSIKGGATNATVYGYIWNNTAVSSTVSLNAWHMLSITYDPAGGASTTKFYVDGALAATTGGTYLPSGATDYFTTYIPGAKPAGVNSYLTGQLDEVRAYNRVLSAAEIAALFTARLSCATSTCASCPVGQTSCSGSCVTTATDNDNCGGCGIVCNTSGGETCLSSVCGCVTGTDCSTVCTVTTADSNNCGGCGIACSTATPAAIDSGLLGHWHLDEGTGATSADASGNGRTAVLTSSPTWTAAGYSGSALSFDGATNHLGAPVSNWLGGNNTISASAWVYATSTTNGPIVGVASVYPSTTGNWNMPFLSIAGPTVYGHLWQVNGNVPLSSTVTLNAWHHLAVSYDPAGSPSERFYVDGAQVATATGTFVGSGLADYWTTYIPGAKPSGVNSTLRGKIDEVRIYNRTLSAAELAIIYYSRQTCSGSTCGGCQNSETLCSSVCTDTAIDTGNCGTCGHTCNTAGGETCTAGVCGCATGTDCSTVCVDMTTNQNNCGSCGNACGATTCGSCDSGLLGKWTLSEGTGLTSADTSGIGNTMNLSGATPPVWTTGHTGNGLQFNGGTGYVTATIGSWFGSSNTMSVSAWVYATSTTNGPIFGVTNTKPGTGWNMPFLSINGATVWGWIWNNTAMSATVSLNNWHLLSLTFDPAGSPTTRFYVDGVQAATATGAYTGAGVGMTDYLTTQIQGAKPSGVNTMLTGIIDDLRAYKRVLSAGEIALLYNAQQTCAASSCGSCPTGTTSCGGVCTNTAADNNNCNTCGNVCPGVQLCVSSVCL
jgi:hypothetical protein